MKEYISKKYEIVARLQMRGKHFEFWLPIKDFPNYEVSTEGHVRNIKTKYIKKTTLSGRKKDNYFVEISNKMGFRTKSVSRLVLEAFATEPFVKSKIIHLDGNTANNSISNLEYKDDFKKEDDSFKPIVGFENYSINKKGDILNTKRKRIIVQALDKDGYVKATLSKNGRTNYFRVSRLVAQTFIPNPNNLPFVNHINGIKTDNRVENLEWCTARENSLHAYRTGLAPRKEKIKHAKLKESYIPWIKEMRKVGISTTQIARVYKVSSKTICSVLNGETWQ